MGTRETLTLSNCLIFAILLYIKRYVRWHKRGRPFLLQPYILVRRSRLAPKVIPHILYAERRSHSPRIWRVVSFVPVRKPPLKWWNFWRSFLFRGRVKWGDDVRSD